MISIYKTIFAQNVSDFGFAAVGDMGCNGNSYSTVQNIIEKQPVLLLGLGDFSYVDSTYCWFEIVEPIDEILKIVIGNHDDENLRKLNNITNHFGLKEQYYSFDYQNTHFLQMSSEIPYKKGSKQYDFVDKDLNKAASDPSINWIIVDVHQALYSSDSNTKSKSSLRETYHELFDRYNVDLVLQGHVHNYQRSYPLNFNIDNSVIP